MTYLIVSDYGLENRSMP